MHQQGTALVHATAALCSVSAMLPSSGIAHALQLAMLCCEETSYKVLLALNYALQSVLFTSLSSTAASEYFCDRSFSPMMCL
jgi:hypothetical protein